jgi:hypothetical protein
MQTRDDDIEFDFFDDEPATAETQSHPRVGGGLRRRPAGPTGPSRGFGPILRLAAFVVLVIVVVLVFGLLINSCSSSSRHSAYASYMNKVDAIASSSTANGKSVQTALTALKVQDIVSKLQGIADNEQQNVQAAESLNIPGRLREENRYLVQALQLRAAGIASLANAFQSTANSKNNAADANLLAMQADRLLASDVIWDDYFKALTNQQLQHDGVSGVIVPASSVVTGAQVTPHAMALVLQRIRGASTGGTVSGLHGTNIVSVKANPGGKVLSSSSSLNTITASTDLSIAVEVQDSGNFQETHIPVTLTITAGSKQSPIVKTQEIQLINPGETATVTFTDLGDVPIATPGTLKVDVKPVPGETKISNNSASFNIILSLPG